VFETAARRVQVRPLVVTEVTVGVLDWVVGSPLTTRYRIVSVVVVVNDALAVPKLDHWPEFCALTATAI